MPGQPSYSIVGTCVTRDEACRSARPMNRSATVARHVRHHGAWHMTDETILLTYDELAERLGIERESARQLVLRKRWDRRKGNDGKARIEVPLDALPAENDPSDDTSHDTGFDPSVITVLTRHIERLEAALDEEKAKVAGIEAERDAARAEARDATRDMAYAREGEIGARALLETLKAAIEGEKALLASERDKASELKADRDRWAEAAAKAEERAGRPWWKRLAG